MIKVVIVDDSRIFRTILKQVLQTDRNIELVAEFANGQDLINYLSNHPWPDYIILDVEMPVLNGLDTLLKIKELKNKDKTKNTQVIMLSSLTREGADTTIKALQYGAFDFLAKPNTESIGDSLTYLKSELLTKLTYLSKETVAPPIKKNSSFVNSKIFNISKKGDVEAIIIGVSTGGPKALSEMLPKLVKVTNLPILIVQHMLPTFTKSLAMSLDRLCPGATVKEGEDGEIVKNNHVYIAPGGKHMIVRKQDNNYVIGITDTPPENNCKPSVDVLFRSAAMVYNGHVISIILTGMGDDGSKSLLSLKRKGAKIIAQDKETSTVWGMPGSAVATGLVDFVLPLQEIPNKVKDLLT